MPDKRRGRQGRQQTREEWTALIFDFYKHLATLSGAGAAVVLVVYQEGLLSLDLITLALALFALSAACCTLGMYRLLIWFPYGMNVDSDGKNDLPFLLQTAVNCTAQALVSLLLSWIDVPSWLAVTLLILAVVLVILIFFADHRVKAVVSKVWSWRLRKK